MGCGRETRRATTVLRGHPRGRGLGSWWKHLYPPSPQLPSLMGPLRVLSAPLPDPAPVLTLGGPVGFPGPWLPVPLRELDIVGPSGDSACTRGHVPGAHSPVLSPQGCCTRGLRHTHSEAPLAHIGSCRGTEVCGKGDKGQGSAEQAGVVGPDPGTVARLRDTWALFSLHPH